MKIRVVIKEDVGNSGYIVHYPVLKGCWSQGVTIEEAMDAIKEAIAGWLNILNERAMSSIKSQDKALVREVAVI